MPDAPDSTQDFQQPILASDPAPQTQPSGSLPTWTQVISDPSWQGLSVEQKQNVLNGWSGEVQRKAQSAPDYNEQTQGQLDSFKAQASQLISNGQEDFYQFKKDYQPATLGNTVAGAAEGAWDTAKTLAKGAGEAIGGALTHSPIEDIYSGILNTTGAVAKAATGASGIVAKAGYALSSANAHASGQDQQNVPPAQAALMNDPVYRDYVKQKFSNQVDQWADKYSTVPGANPDIATAGSMIIPGPAEGAGIYAGMERGALKQAMQSGVMGAVSKGADVASNLADTTGQILQAPFHAYEKILQNNPAAEVAVGGAFHHFIPGIVEALGTATAVGKAADAGSNVLEAISEIANKSKTPSQLSAFNQVANDVSQSPIVRRLAQAAGSTPIAPILSTAGDFAKGSAVGIGIGTGLGLLQGQSGEQLGQTIGSGATQGGLGYLGGKLASSDPRFQEAQDADRNAFIQRHANDPRFGSTDISTLPKNILQQAADAELMGGGQFQVRFADPDAFNEISPNGQGVFIKGSDGTNQVILNKDAIQIGDQSLAHEIGHAIYNSPSTDKTIVNTILQNSLGEDKIAQYKQEYAAKVLKSESVQSPNPQQIQNKIQELNQTAGSDWVNSELFAEYFTDHAAAQGVLSLARSGKIQGVPTNFLAQAALSAKNAFLSKLGFTFKNDGSGEFQSPNQVFRSPLARDPNIKAMIQNYMVDLSKYRKGLTNAKTLPEEGGVIVPPSQAATHPAVKNVLTYTDANGIQRFKTDKQLIQEEKAKKQFVSNLNEIAPQVKDSDYTKFGKRTSGPVQGKTGFADLMEKSGVYSPEDVSNARTIEQAIKDGDVISSWYRANIRNRGNIPVSYRNFSPWNVVASKAGQLRANSIDMDALNRHVTNLQEKGKLDLFDDNQNQFWNDFKTLTANHSEEKPGASGIGEAKYQFFRNMFGFTDTKGSLNNEPKSSFIRSFRIDNMANPKPMGDSLYGIDYNKMKKNLKP